MRTPLRRALAGLTVTAVAASGALLAPAAQAANSRADSAGDWLAGQLSARHLVISGYQDDSGWHRYVDHGLSLDFLFALNRAGIRPKVRADILEAMESQTGAYVGTGGTTYAGALGKLISAVQVEDEDVDTFAGGGLVGVLEDLVVTDGAEAGRAKDVSGWGDSSNTVGQSWVVRALATEGSALADDTAAFLLAQQCAGGGFRLYLESPDFTCATGTPAQRARSVDATAFALQALMVARDAGVSGLQDDIDQGVAWLVARQRPSGAFRESGVANVNSTGLAAETLALAGEKGAAGNAAVWLSPLQVAGARATGRLARDRGAVAFNASAWADGRKHGITREVRYQWRRATAQAVAGLDVLLPKRALVVRAPGRAEHGEWVTVVAKGLEPGERYRVHRGSPVVSVGLVPGNAVVRLRLRMPRRDADVTVTVVGSRGNRVGRDVVHVR